MKPISCLGILVLISGLLPSFSARAQFNGDGQTLTIDGFSDTHTGDFYISETNNGCKLVVTNGGMFQVFSKATFPPEGGHIYLGSFFSSNSSIHVTGSGSVLNNAGSLYVGYYANNNSTTVSDDGLVNCHGLRVGNLDRKSVV